VAVVVGPGLRRRQLGAELRRMRNDAGIRIDEAAAALECSPSRVSRIENGMAGATPKERDVRDLARLYGVEHEPTQLRLLDMLREARQPGWWEEFNDVLTPKLQAYVALETDAHTEQAFAAHYLPGLLQTEDYARAAIGCDRRLSADRVARLVELRMARRDLLTRDEQPLRLCAVLDEAAVRRPVGGAKVMATQLEAIIALLHDLPGLSVQVIPFGVGAHFGLNGGFTLLDFGELGAQVVYVENALGNFCVEDSYEVRTYLREFDQLTDLALSPADSLAFMERVMLELRG
jgi:transcriptional regulator with XRE-family HTH domain